MLGRAPLPKKPAANAAAAMPRPRASWAIWIGERPQTPSTDRPGMWNIWDAGRRVGPPVGGVIKYSSSPFAVARLALTRDAGIGQSAAGQPFERMISAKALPRLRRFTIIVSRNWNAVISGVGWACRSGGRGETGARP